MNVNAKRLIVSLISASRGRTVSAAEVIAASALFGVADSNVRVILLRSVAEGVLEQPARGVYALSASSRQLADEVRLWRTKETRVRPWHGDYAVVLVDRLQKLDLVSKRRRSHALRLMGFKALKPELQVRPNNIENSIPHLRQRLISLGLEDSALVFSATDFEASTIKAIHGLWDCDALGRLYQDETSKLQRWLDQAQQTEIDTALRETYRLGAEAIRVIAFDPMLPESMVDSEARKRLIDTACRFDDLGHSLWMRFLDGRIPSSGLGAGKRVALGKSQVKTGHRDDR